MFSRQPFEKGIALENATIDNVLAYINYQCYFDLLNQKLPDSRDVIIHRLISEKIILQKNHNFFDITNLGAILFANNLSTFGSLSRKAIRVVIYQGQNRIETQREKTGKSG